MSRIGQRPILLPQGVKVHIRGLELSASGPKGELRLQLPPGTRAELSEGKLQILREGESARFRALHGLARSLAQNAVRGVHEGFEKRLEIQGLGYRAAVEGGKLSLQLGFSHPLEVEIPKTLSVTVEKQTLLCVSGASKAEVGEFAARLRALRPPDPYKGTGIKYADEVIHKKAGKVAAVTGQKK